MSTAVNSGSAAHATAPAANGPSPTPGQRSAASRASSNARRNMGSPSNDGPQGQKRGSKPWGNHGSQQGQGNGSAYNGQRGTYANNYGRQSPVSETDSADRHMYDRLLYLLIRAVGSSVVATVRSGARYSGILSSAQTHGDVGVALRFARQIAAPPGEELADEAHEAVVSTLLIQPKDLLDLKILEVNLTDQNGFRTDTDISRNPSAEQKQRELQPWKPDDSIPLESLDDLETSGAGTWDQFAVNEQLFGLQTTFDENIYTTKLDKSHPQYKERAAAAERIAREIESSSYGGNIHIAEERGIQVDDSGVDEEDKYSGVIREKVATGGLQSGSANRYAPPALRQKLAQQQQQVQNQVPQQQQHNAQQTPASQVDSAILSSKISEPAPKVPSPAPVGASAAASIPAPATDAPEPVASASADDGEATTATAAEVAATTKASTTEKPVLEHIKVAAAAKVKGPLTATEFDHQTMMGTFKQFVHGEKERLNLKKREISKKEKEGRLSELMAFSQSFKLHTPVPMDLVPILAKDKAKQEEIIQKSVVNAKQTDAKKPLSTADIVNAVQQQNPAVTDSKVKPVGQNLSAKLQQLKNEPNTGSVPVPSPPDIKATPSSPAPAKRLNVKAMEFKPNPFAASFTPSFGGSTAGSGTPAASVVSAASSSPTPPPPPPAATPRTVNKPAARSDSPAFFGPQWKPPAQPRASINDGFNPFTQAKEEHTGDELFTITKAYTFPPTWPYSDNPSHTELFTVPEPASMQRIYGIPPLPGTPLPFSPASGTSIPSGQVSPSVNGSATPFAPPMPQGFEDTMRPMIPGASPPVASPSMAPQMIPAPTPFSPPMMYAQQPYPPPYYTGRPPNMPPGFIAAPPPPMPQQFIPHQGFPAQYLPPQQVSPSQGYGSPGRNSHQATMMMPAGQQAGFSAGFYGQPQSEFCLSNQYAHTPSPTGQGGHGVLETPCTYLPSLPCPMVSASGDFGQPLLTPSQVHLMRVPPMQVSQAGPGAAPVLGPPQVVMPPPQQQQPRPYNGHQDQPQAQQHHATAPTVSME
ncbi:hypothetical protein V1525DRAFT_386972 [Lipomyces kononenkoae]|uniref:Uncharacterized protein n=1 Tax=Lipomyces kononenkoae TaxID=34357 RepID=A0ACC3T5J9_LIPKO